jgi:long-chain fatty acid transport protein
MCSRRRKSGENVAAFCDCAGNKTCYGFWERLDRHKEDSREGFMARGILKLATAAFAVTVAASAAQAGGFSRGTADTDILYEDSNFNLRAGVTYVSPSRKYSKAFDPQFVGFDPYKSFAIMSGAAKFNITDDFRCATTFAQPYGGGQDWPVPYRETGKRSEEFTVNEFGATCGYKFDLAKGRAWIIGGLYYETFDYDLVAGGGALAVNLNSYDFGYRVGAAYEIPEIALKVEGMYRSGTEHFATGFGNNVLPATGDGSLPQSFELKAQSGIAEGWLGFVNVKWTDWSVLDRINLRVPLAGVSTANIYNWKDGWTVTAGVGHAFSDKISGAAQITWDRGVGTGWDLSSDTWTLGVGGSFKPDMGGELRLGTGLSYLTSAKETQYAPALNAEVKGGWALALSGSFKVNW